MSSLSLSRTDDGCITLAVRVTPRARKTECKGVSEGDLLVRIAAPPVDGKANQVLTAYLAKALGLKKSQVTIRSGDKSRRKIVMLRGAQEELILALARGEEK